MLDGLFKSKIDLFWDRLGMFLVKLRLTPNMVTVGGLVLVVLSSLYFIVFKDSFWFGVFLAITFAADSLDGAVARITGKSTKFGSYLDAVADRYQEILVYFVIAYVRGYWGSVFWVITGSLLISYNKARVAVDTPIRNDNWPDLLERMERVILLCVTLLLDGLFPDKNILWYAIVIIAILAHFTAIQRFFRARRILVKKDISLK